MSSPTYKNLGQAFPGASYVETALYTVPLATNTIISTIAVTQVGATVPDLFNIRIAVGGASSTNSQYICYQVGIVPGTPWPYTAGITMGPSDVMYVSSANGTCAFNIFGVQYA